MMIPVVDVRDCARGHILALEKGQTGERYILSGDCVRMVDVSRTLYDEYGHRGYPKIPRKVMPVCMLNCLACCVKEIRHLKPMMNYEYRMDNTKAQKELGVDFRPYKETVVEMIPSMIEQG